MNCCKGTHGPRVGPKKASKFSNFISLINWVAIKIVSNFFSFIARLGILVCFAYLYAYCRDSISGFKILMIFVEFRFLREVCPCVVSTEMCSLHKDLYRALALFTQTLPMELQK